LPSSEKNDTQSEPESELEKLRYDYSLLLQERNRAVGELSSLGEALADCQRRRLELESSLKRIKDTDLSPEYAEATSTKLKFLEEQVDSLSKANTRIESLLFKSMMLEPQATEKARQYFLNEGSLTYRVLLLVTDKGSTDINQIARATGLNQSTLNQVIEALAREHALEVRGAVLSVPGALRLPDTEMWRRLPLDKVFDEVEKYITAIRSPELVIQALQGLKDEIESKARTRGTITFELGKEIQAWKRGTGSQQDLRFKIRDWKTRTQQ
jgi:DNA-binding Lrp family transcriptional regulator